LALKGETDLAIADFTTAIRLMAPDPSPYAQRAEAYVKKGEYDLAIADYTKIIQAQPGALDAYAAAARF